MKLRRRFTRWYVKNGWTYEHTYIPHLKRYKNSYNCPWYVKPFLFLFSSSTYYAAVITKLTIARLFAGMCAKEKTEVDKNE